MSTAKKNALNPATTLRDYARTPVRFQPVKRPPSPSLDRRPRRRSRHPRERRRAAGEIADLEAQLDAGEERAEALPHRQKYLLLVIGFLRRLLDIHLELVDEVERELR
jgi:hypothetical protein